jgi:DNA-binding transcriptional LysR family regulator
LRFENVSVRTIDDLESRMGGIDALLLPTGFVDGFPHFEVFRDEWVCVAWSGNDEIDEGVTLNVLRESRRISTFDTARSFTYADRQLDILDFRRSSVVADGFLATPFLLTGTRSVALLPRRIAELTRDAAALRILPVHLDAPPLIESVWWHEAHNADPGHRWLRRLLRQAAGELALPGSSSAPSIA